MINFTSTAANFRKNIFSLIFLLLTIFTASGQYATRHYLPAAPWFYFDQANELIVSTDQPSSTVTVSKSDGTFITTLVVTANNPVAYRFTNPVAGAGNTPAHNINTTYNDRGIILSGTSRISVSIRNVESDSINGGQPQFIKGNASMSSYGDQGIGTDFRVGYYRANYGGLSGVNGSPAEPVYSVMAITNGTNVLLNGTVLVTLNAGQTYFFQTTIGSLIETSKPSVMMAGQWGDAPGGCTDSIFTQIIPTPLADNNYFIIRGNGNVTTQNGVGPEQSIVIATVPNTNVTITNYDNAGVLVNTSTVNLPIAGSFNNFVHGSGNLIYSSTTVTSDKRVVIYSGIADGCENDMSMIPPIQPCSGSLNVQTYKFTRYNNTDLPFVGYIAVRSPTEIVTLNGINVETISGVTPRFQIGSTGIYLIKFTDAALAFTSTPNYINVSCPSRITANIVQQGGGFSMAGYYSSLNDTPLQPTLSPALSNGCTPTITAEAGLAPYQWYYEDVIIPGATNQTYTPTLSGNYSVAGTRPCGFTRPSAQVFIIACEICNDGIDNDGDGLIDGADPDCSTYSCSNKILITRQVGADTQLAQVDVVGNDFNINTINTYPGLLLNASVYYNGFVYAMNNGNTIYKLGSLPGASTNSVLTGLPSRVWNNAGVTFNGRMYMLDNGTFNLYTIDLTTTAPTLLAGPTAITLVGANSGDIAANVIWGDIAIDPTNGKIYVWYHPTVANTRPGLYELNISTNQLNLVGAITPQTMGCLAFDKLGNLYSYGSTAFTTQDRLWSVNKLTGVVTQIGTPDIAVTQADGLSCVFTAAITLSSPATVNYSSCSATNFNFTYGIVNSSGVVISGANVTETLDSRLSFSTAAATLQTTLAAIYGAGVTVAITSASGGTNNVLTISNMTLPVGTTNFSIGITKLAGSVFNNNEVVSNTATLAGLPSALGSATTSDNPNTIIPDDATNFTINLTPCTNLSIVKTASSLTPTVGSNITFTLTETNAGPSNATGVTVTDILAAGYTFVNATPSVGNYVSGTGVWTIGALANGASATLSIVATVNSSGSYGNTATTTGTETDPALGNNTSTVTPIPVANNFSISNTSITEGGIMAFVISLTSANANATVINVTTTTGTAGTADFTSVTTSVTIAAGQTSTTFNVATTQDTIDEPNENFTLNGTIASGNTSNNATSGLGTINDDDPTPSISISSPTVTNEGDPAAFVITLSGTSSVDTVINVTTANGSATAPGDYTTTTQTVTIIAGQTTATVNVPTINDVVVEGAETFVLDGTVTSGNTSNTNPSGTATISPNDTAIVSVTATTASAAEGGANGLYTFNITNPSSTATTVTYTVTGTALNGTDYTTIATTVVIPANATSVTLQIGRAHV